MSVIPHHAALYRWLIIKNHLYTPKKINRLLDIGSNDGYIASQIPANSYTSVDIQPVISPSSRIHWVQASVEQLPIITDSFDCILAFDILEHVEHDRRVMHEMLRLLSKDGIIYFSVPTLKSSLFPKFISPYANRSFGHVRNGYTPEQIQALLPNTKEWAVEWFYWNEPCYRFIFVLLYFLKLIPILARSVTKLCYLIDKHFKDGEHGHLFGVIRRSTT